MIKINLKSYQEFITDNNLTDTSMAENLYKNYVDTAIASSFSNSTHLEDVLGATLLELIKDSDYDEKTMIFLEKIYNLLGGSISSFSINDHIQIIQTMFNFTNKSMNLLLKIKESSDLRADYEYRKKN